MKEWTRVDTPTPHSLKKFAYRMIFNCQRTFIKIYRKELQMSEFYQNFKCPFLNFETCKGEKCVLFSPMNKQYPKETGYCSLVLFSKLIREKYETSEPHS